MESANSDITNLFQAYRDANNLPLLPMNCLYERLVYEAMQMGLTPDMIFAVIASRKRGKREGRFVKGTHIQHIFGEDAAYVIDEFHHLQALGRVKVMDPNRSSVLRQTGRSDQIPSSEARSAADLELVKKLREAAQ
jgi:hypothetical protein